MMTAGTRVLPTARGVRVSARSRRLISRVIWRARRAAPKPSRLPMTKNKKWKKPARDELLSMIAADPEFSARRANRDAEREERKSARQCERGSLVRLLYRRRRPSGGNC